MTISVIIPVYNSQSTIIDTLESVLSQTVSPHEIIIIDDASSDDSYSVIEEYLKKKSLLKVKIILKKSKINRGPGLTRNFGLSLSSGTLICFCDSDDIWMQDKLREQLNYINDFPIIGTSYQIKTKSKKSLQSIDLSGVYDYQNFLTFNPLVLSSVMLDTRRIPIDDIKFLKIFHEDFLLWLNILKKYNYNVYVLREYFVIYNRRNNGFSSGTLKKINSTFKVYKLHGFSFYVSIVCASLKIIKSLNRYV
jgi:teichuronic acid biosynthesis glycosyltransferase TuaG